MIYIIVAWIFSYELDILHGVHTVPEIVHGTGSPVLPIHMSLLRSRGMKGGEVEESMVWYSAWTPKQGMTTFAKRGCKQNPNGRVLRVLWWALGFKCLWGLAVWGLLRTSTLTVALGQQTLLKQAEQITSRLFPKYAGTTSQRLPEATGRDFEEEPELLFQGVRAHYPARADGYHCELICSQRQWGLWHSWCNT